MHTIWRWTALSVWAAVVLIWLLIGTLGQHWGWLAFLVYLPPLIGPTLLLALAAPGLWLRSRLSWLLIGTALFIAGPGLGWRTHQPPVTAPTQATDLRLSVITCNRGQHHGHSITDFVKGHAPDIVGLQDSGEANAFIPAAPEWKELTNMTRFGEFVTLSRYPIQISDIKQIDAERTTGGVRVFNYAARHIMRVGDRQIVVYNVHLPSPRHVLTGVVKPGDGLERFWELQQRILTEFSSILAAETPPVVVLGDWNVPSFGPRYRQITARLQDAQDLAGSGYGFTAPGDVNHFLAFRRAWLRLDYVLASRDWKVVSCEVEPASQAQHAAVHAELRLR